MQLFKLSNKPVKILFTALDTELEITQEFKEVYGIYLLWNNMRSKLLIGSGKNLSRRLSEYYSPAKLNYKNKNNQLRPIHAVILKYGHEQFNVII